jgi:predicted dehydrogenase
MSADPALVRVGVVGSGSMAEYHVKKFAALSGVVVAGCSDRQAEQAREFARRLHIPRWFGSAVELAGSSAVDCIAAAVVDAGHASAALAALERGIPVFAEKPLARCLDEAVTLHAAALTAAVPAMVNFSKRNAGALGLARSLVAEGRIGTVRGGSFSYLQSWLLQDAWGRWDRTPRLRWRLSPAMSTDGVIGDLGSHIMDSLLFVAGEIRAVSCSATVFTDDPDNPGSSGAPDSFCAVFTMANGALFSGRASWRAPGSLDSFTFSIEGDSGTISADLSTSRGAVKLFDCFSGTWSELAAGPSRSTYQLFIDAVRSRADAPYIAGSARPDFQDGLSVQRVIDACARSASSGRVISLSPLE